jgi:SpoVK/Ycf46/Vps4 family AAA+-type ATPase
MANTRFAGTIAEVSDLNTTNTSGKSVINMWVERTEEIIEGIKEEVRARIVLFGDLAEKAEDQIDEGKIVMFTNCQRNPRTYVTDLGTEVETVDIVARGFKVLTKTQYEKARDQIDAMSLTSSELEFTDKDRQAIYAKESASAGPIE